MDQQDAPTSTEPDSGSSDTTAIDTQAGTNESSSGPEVKYTFDEESGSYTFKSDGQEVTASRTDLIRSYQQEQAITRKTNELAETNKAREAEHQQALQQVSERQERLDALLEQFEGLTQADDDIDRLLEEGDTAEALRLQRQKAKQAETLSKAKAELEQSRKDEADAASAREAQALLKAIPEWSDHEVRRTEWEGVSKVMQSLGFSAQEISDQNEHKVFLMANELRKANAELERLKTAKETKEVKDLPTSIKSNPSAASQPKSLEERMYGTG